MTEHTAETIFACKHHNTSPVSPTPPCLVPLAKHEHGEILLAPEKTFCAASSFSPHCSKLPHANSLQFFPREVTSREDGSGGGTHAETHVVHVHAGPSLSPAVTSNPVAIPPSQSCSSIISNSETLDVDWELCEVGWEPC